MIAEWRWEDGNGDHEKADTIRAKGTGNADLRPQSTQARVARDFAQHCCTFIGLLTAAYAASGYADCVLPSFFRSIQPGYTDRQAGG